MVNWNDRLRRMLPSSAPQAAPDPDDAAQSETEDAPQTGNATACSVERPRKTELKKEAEESATENFEPSRQRLEEARRMLDEAGRRLDQAQQRREEAETRLAPSAPTAHDTAEPMYEYSPFTPPPNEDYLAPTCHDNENVPLGRLKALCPRGPEPERPAQEAISAFLARAAKETNKAKKAKRQPEFLLGNDLDMLAARGLYNASCSALCRLPEDVLARIMDHLDFIDMFFLRHTSRVFMRLFSTRNEFAAQRDADAARKNSNSLYTAPLPWLPPIFTTDARLRFNLRRRGYDAGIKCAGCGGHNIYRFYDMFMHCTKCDVDHPMSLFSGNMIRSDSRAIMLNRMCQAHEGHVRLCQHKTVDWATVVGSLPGGRLDNNFRNDPNANQQSSAEGDTRPFSVDADLRVVCDHPSHAMHPHHAEPDANPGSGREPREPRETRENDVHAVLPPYERFSTAGEHHQDQGPSFVVHDTIVDGVNHKVITWSYTAHLDLAGAASGPGGNGAITAQAFRDRVHSLRIGRSPVHYIAPPDYPGILPELRCVDPERCHCLVYPGFQRRATLAPAACREHEVVRPLSVRMTDIDHLRVRLASCDRAPRCLRILYTRTIRLQGFFINPAPEWLPALVTGNRMNSYSIFVMLRDAFRNGSVPLGWYQALDPQSYRATDDPARHHLECAA
ncbi:hypothetical protein SCUCBS95973_000665 [Sporothrix curviconia]|uniref:F-box domain-containing protein n=1 Tax=Sporothrix curviconia TaxID=1260050 RepID=A0ABP0AS50_9PEZI